MVRLWEQTEAEKVLSDYVDNVDKIWAQSKKELQGVMRKGQTKKALGLMAGKTLTAKEAEKLSKQELKGIMADVRDKIDSVSIKAVGYATTLGWEAPQLAGIVERVGWQQAIADDVTKSIYDRLSHVFDVKYGTLAEYEKCMDRMWGVDKERLLTAFRDELAEHTGKLISGDLTAAGWEKAMADTISQRHEGIFAAAQKEYGGTGDLTKEQLSWLHKEIADEQKYLANFRADIEAVDLVNVSPDAIAARADLYAGKGNTLYQAGKASAFEGQDVLIHWNLGLPMTEHCDDCPDLAAGSPYTPTTLPCYPGDGNTQCMTNCCCSLDYEIVDTGEIEGEII